jgi:hypothetical protein
MVYAVGLLTRHTQSRMSLRVFTPMMRAIWAVLAAVTIVLEVVPIPPMAPLYFYAYCAGKASLFALLGYLAPLAFWSFNALNRGIIFAALSACGVETLQGLLAHGHSFHWYELVVKLGIILLGFALALNDRYDHEINIGPIRIRLIGEHV